jgi:phosphoribosylaminoimidazole-succinocarboxamide synthase
MQSMRTLLDEIANSGSRDILNQHCYYGLSDVQISTLAMQDIQTYKGKVREVLSKGQELFIVHTDRLTAFDRMIAMVPYKGLVLTEISEFWLKEASKVVPTHYLSRPDERIIQGKRTTPFKIEVVVRGYMAGSMMRAYENGERDFCGERLQDGLQAWTKLPKNIITPTTKAAAFEHDENTTPAQLIASGVVTKDEWKEISAMAYRLFEYGQKVYDEFGWILVDTKYEFGKTSSGEIIVIDEVHTPDSSRLWEKSTYATNLAQKKSPDMLDKETVRRFLLEQGFSGYGDVPVVPTKRLLGLAEVYLNVCEKLLGKALTTVGNASQPDFSLINSRTVPYR